MTKIYNIETKKCSSKVHSLVLSDNFFLALNNFSAKWKDFLLPQISPILVEKKENFLRNYFQIDAIPF